MASDEKIGELIQAIENLRGAVNRLSDEASMIRDSLPKLSKPQTKNTGMLNHMRLEHAKSRSKK